MKPSKLESKCTVLGGHIELGESSQEAVKRGSRGKLGLDVESVRLLFVQEATFKADYLKYEHYIFMDCL